MYLCDIEQCEAILILIAASQFWLTSDKSKKALYMKEALHLYLSIT
jgi:hypothetical protein